MKKSLHIFYRLLQYFLLFIFIGIAYFQFIIVLSSVYSSDQDWSIYEILFLCIWLFSSLFFILITVKLLRRIPDKNFRTKRGIVEWINIMCIVPICISYLISTYYLGIFDNIRHFLIWRVDILHLVLIFVLTFVLYYRRTVNTYIVMAIVSVIILLIYSVMPFISPVDLQEQPAEYVSFYYEALGWTYILLLSALFTRVMLTTGIALRNLRG